MLDKVKKKITRQEPESKGALKKLFSYLISPVLGKKFLEVELKQIRNVFSKIVFCHTIDLWFGLKGKLGDPLLSP